MPLPPIAELLPKLPDLSACLWDLIGQVPAGRVATCGGLAAALGSPQAAVWIAHETLHHTHAPGCPCHRVVRADGRLGPFAGGAAGDKARLLRQEGVRVSGGKVDLAACLFAGFVGAPPLARLREAQADLARRIVLCPRRRLPRLVGGVDVAYPAADQGVAAYALVDVASGGLVWSHVLRAAIRFPYISTFLAFRELPILLELLAAVRAAGRLADVVLVDGSGVLHQRHAGVAAHLGVVAGRPTIGVAKTLLCGDVDPTGMAPGESRPVVYQGRAVGVALRTTCGSRRPLFISPGHRADVAFAERVVRATLAGHRLPEPIYWADRLGKQAQP